MPGKKRENRYHLAGWVLFLLCAALFFFSSIRDGDGVLALASFVFFLGCVLFLIPLLFPHKETEGIRKCDEDKPPDEGS